MPPEEELAHPLSDRFTDALAYAATLHRTQARKGTPIPYVSHLIGVASLVLEHQGTEDEAIAALLHDAIEDQGGPKTGDVIRERFGHAVYAIVKGCTDTELEPKPAWRERKENYVAHVRHAPASVKLVSAADKLYNARTILKDYRALGQPLWDRFTGGRDGTLWYYRALVEALAAGSPTDAQRALVDELGRVVAEIEWLAHGGGGAAG
jgi:(p)ppGpp synthase/HD superfamily hydrolase